MIRIAEGACRGAKSRVMRTRRGSGRINRLIMLRRNEKTCRSPHFHFPNTYENGRCVEYVKIDEEGNKIEVLLNASNENVKVKGEGEILFARKFDGDILGANGTLIRKIGVTIQ